MRFLILPLFIALSIWSCKSPGPPPLHVVSRDTTITKENSYTNLFVDSMQMENFLSQEVLKDSTHQRIKNFYNSRNFAFAWFDADGLTVEGEGFWNRHRQYIGLVGDSSVYNKDLHVFMDRIMEGDSLALIPSDALQLTELRLTAHFFNYVKAAYGSKADPEELQWHIPKRKLDPAAMLDSMLSTKRGDWSPLNSEFHLLRKAVVKYRDLQKQGGGDSINLPKKQLKKSQRDPIVAAVKHRLSLTNDYPSTDTTSLFTDSLATTIQKVRLQFGLSSTAFIDAALVKALNVPIEKRIRQMLLNMERMKWMPEAQQDYIVVNIPEYRLRVYEKGSEALSMNVVVGKAANRTVVFSDELQYVVLSPYWNLPRSIVRNEIQPAMQRNSNYLSRNGMEITGYSGGLPIIRQKPGRGNALGQVKFIFPNSYSIYFHDTPAKSLFSRDKRAFSHGCIRLQEPFELAMYLLRNNKAWTASSIKKGMNSENEKWITLQDPLPVYITYFTSWADKEGLPYFREDIYGHDKKLADMLFK